MCFLDIFELSMYFLHVLQWDYLRLHLAVLGIVSDHCLPPLGFSLD